MVRRYRRSYRSGNRDKYSIENTVTVTPSNIQNWDLIEGSDINPQSRQFRVQIVTPSPTEGMRKVKHLTLSFSGQTEAKIFYAIVYVPAGYEPNSLNLPLSGGSVSLYEPNQYVMSSGVLDFQGGPLRIRSPLSRNLNSGDSIALVMATDSELTSSYSIAINTTYAITLQ